MSTRPPTRDRTTPVIARVLSNEDHFGNRTPTWLGAPRSADAQEARKKAVKRLRRFANDFPAASQLATILDNCKPSSRCMSGACPECGRAFQRWFVGQVTKLAEATSYPLWAVSIAIAENRTPENRLHTLHTTSMRKALTYALNKVPEIEWLAGGIDLSLNDDTQKGSDIGWLPQFYGFVATSNTSALSTLLHQRYPNSKHALRPIRIRSCDGSPKALSYSFKSEFVRRISYKAIDQHGRWDTRKVSLAPKNHVQALLWMHQIGLSGRLFLKNVRMTRIDHHVELRTIKQLK